MQVTRWIIDQPAPPAFVKIGGFTGNVDRWQIIDYMPPSFIRLDVGATPTGTGAPEGRRVGGIQMRNLNAMTPETETTTHYFWGQAHDFEPHNAEMTERVFQQIKTAFLEDVSVFTDAAAEHRPRSRRADDRHQRRFRRHPGPPHRRPALCGRAGGDERRQDRGGVGRDRSDRVRAARACRPTRRSDCTRMRVDPGTCRRVLRTVLPSSSQPNFSFAFRATSALGVLVGGNLSRHDHGRQASMIATECVMSPLARFSGDSRGSAGESHEPSMNWIDSFGSVRVSIAHSR